MNTPFTRARKTIRERFTDEEMRKTIAGCCLAAEERKLDAKEINRMLMLATGVNALLLKYMLYMLDRPEDLSVPEVLKLTTAAKSVARNLTEAVNAATKMLLADPNGIPQSEHANLPPEFEEVVSVPPNGTLDASK